VLWNDPATGVMRHADAGYELAQQTAREVGLKLPMLAAEHDGARPGAGRRDARRRAIRARRSSRRRGRTAAA
jgi:hypothetical protein